MSKPTPFEKLSNQDHIVILGASRGLGWALYRQLITRIPEAKFLLSSRKIFDRQMQVEKNTTLLAQDFSKNPVADDFLNSLKQFQPTRIIYVAGGGPFGPYAAKKWSDHQWAITTTFLYPAELLHRLLSQNESFPSLRQVIFVGSQIAESKPDPNAASYAAAKHALKGLLTTVQLEQAQNLKILLFSPGYMQTELIPAGSWPIQQGLAQEAAVVADQLIEFIEKNN